MGLRGFDVGYSPRIGFHKSRNGQVWSATSIGTEENLLGVLRAHSQALIYMKVSKHSQRNVIQVQRKHVMAE